MATPNPTELNFPNDDPELLEKLVDHFTVRIRSGEVPSIAEYQEQYPEHKDELEDLLSSVAMIEQLKSSSTDLAKSKPSFEMVSSLKQIGNYKIVREVGRGGMGVVFEAIHESLGRRVAIKVVPTPLVNSQKYIERFQLEAKAAAKLHHTNIVSVFGVGQEDGFHYYVMDFVDGQTLSEVIYEMAAGQPPGITTTLRSDETRLAVDTEFDLLNPEDAIESDQATEQSDRNGSGELSSLSNPNDSSSIPIPKLIAKTGSKHFRWIAGLGASIADALEFAHQNKILHRDIKPSNMVLDQRGVVWITDFGLAKDSASETNITKTGDVIGTPQYLAPESLEGKYDQRSEVYGLGLTLYELATFQTAHPNGTTAEVIRSIATKAPISPRKINPKIPIDLSTIIEKSIARAPEARYQTARQLHADLVAFVEDRPISARPPSTLENVVKWGRRNPLAAVLSGVSALLLSLVAVSASIGYLYTTDALENALASEQETKQQFARAEANVEIAIDAFDQMFNQVVARGSSDIDIEGFDELMGVETTVTRQDSAFLKKLLEFYDRFANENADNAALQTESARAFRRAGNIYQLVGDYELAKEAYTKSVDLYQRLYDESKDSKEILISLVQTKTEFSRSLRRLDQIRSGSDPNKRKTAWADAMQENEEAISLLKILPLAQLDDDLKFEFAKTLNTLGSSNTLHSVLSPTENRRPSPRMGMFQFWQGRGRGRGPEQGRESPSHRERPGDGKGSADGREGPRGGGPRGGDRRGSDSNKDQRPSKERSGGANANPAGRGGDGPRNGDGSRGGESRRGPRGGVDRQVNNLSSRSLEILNELVDANPENIAYRSARANTYCSLAWSLIMPEPEKANEMRQKAISELESLIEIDGDNPSYKFRLAMACLLREQPKPNEADASASPSDNLLLQAIGLTSELTEQLPEVPDYHTLHSVVCIEQGELLAKQGELEEALNSYAQAKSSIDRVKELMPSKIPRHGLDMELRNHLADLVRLAKSEKQLKIALEATKLIGTIRKTNGGKTP